MRQLYTTSRIAICLWLALAATTSQALSLGRDSRSLRGASEQPFGTSAIRPRRPARRHTEIKTMVTRSVSSSRSKARSPMTDLTETFEMIWHLSLAKLVVLKATVFTFWIFVGLSIMIWIGLVVVAAYNYKFIDNYYPEIGPLPDYPVVARKQLNHWQFAWYECASDADICLWSFCCPWIRWAHTMDLLHLLEYWPAFAIFFMLGVVNQFTGFVLLGVYFTMLLVYYRQKVRKVYHSAGGPARQVCSRDGLPLARLHGAKQWHQKVFGQL